MMLPIPKFLTYFAMKDFVEKVPKDFLAWHDNAP